MPLYMTCLVSRMFRTFSKMVPAHSWIDLRSIRKMSSELSKHHPAYCQKGSHKLPRNLTLSTSKFLEKWNHCKRTVKIWTPFPTKIWKALRAVFALALDDFSFLLIALHKQQDQKIMKTRDSDPFNQFFNFCRQLKYEKV